LLLATIASLTIFHDGSMSTYAAPEVILFNEQIPPTEEKEETITTNLVAEKVSLPKELSLT